MCVHVHVQMCFVCVWGGGGERAGRSSTPTPSHTHMHTKSPPKICGDKSNFSAGIIFTHENVVHLGCPSNCSNPCTLPAEPGRCRGRFPRYYHNSDSGQCELFIYGGCDGNQNRFNTQEECETACKGNAI